MNLIHYINKHYEEEECLYDVDRQQIILKGDYYHNKIGYKIQGFLEGLEKYHLTYAYMKKILNREDELFYKFEFYDERDW